MKLKIKQWKEHKNNQNNNTFCFVELRSVKKLSTIYADREFSLIKIYTFLQTDKISCMHIIYKRIKKSRSIAFNYKNYWSSGKLTIRRKLLWIYYTRCFFLFFFSLFFYFVLVYGFASFCFSWNWLTEELAVTLYILHFFPAFSSSKNRRSLSLILSDDNDNDKKHKV